MKSTRKSASAKVSAVKPGTADTPQIAGRSRTSFTSKYGLPYTHSTKSAQADVPAWTRTHAAALVEIIMPDGATMNAGNPDEVGAAFMEIIGTLVYLDDQTARENLHSALAALIFDKTDTHDHALSDFYCRRLVLPRT
jgi:hypothetical protein